MLDAAILRIVDANVNRAREALRVLEDYARFALDDDGMSARLKQLRHELAGMTADLAADAILWRDTPGDVGTDNKTARELVREDLPAIITAAGKRLGEALRVIEECLKTVDGATAAAVEQARYRFYDLEQALARTLRPARLFAQVQLYVLITESACSRPWRQVAEAAIAGGADCLQLREKQLESRELLERARWLVELCRRHRVLSIINDRPDIALLSGADGVHVGQDDLPAPGVRALIGRGVILGVSTHRLEQARQAVLDGADYIGAGPVFPSSTKMRDILPGLDYAGQAARAIRLPTVAIAGITLDNVDQVMRMGVRAIAVTAAVAGSDDPQTAAQRLKQRIAHHLAADGGAAGGAGPRMPS
jgi:thiamine-phosphate pyrophosphorylase